jgi:hypothetical protein
LVESYKSHLAGQSKVLMVHLSYDDEPTEALAWAKKEQFPWLTVLEPKVPSVDLEEFTDGGVPDYVLLSADGEVLARGKDEVFEKIKSL